MHIVLYQPEIPQNTGNIARLCAATQVPLHLIEPLGFSLEDKYLKRAGLDYWKNVRLYVWPDLDTYLSTEGKNRRVVLNSTHGVTPFYHFMFTEKDALIFGRETAGLPIEIWKQFEHTIQIPTYTTVRSLNLSTAAGIILYHALINTNIISRIYN